MLTDLQRLEHMLEVAGQMLQIASSTTEEQFAGSVEKQYALKFGFVMLGEDAGQVSKETQDAFPDIPWRIMKGMRNIVIHDYCKTDETILWKTAVNDMQELYNSLAKIVKTLQEK